MLVLSAGGALGIGMILPFTPIASALGLVPMPAAFFAYVAAVIVVYLLLVEAVKRRTMVRVLA
jgi:Mg2+-importing ATPase